VGNMYEQIPIENTRPILERIAMVGGVKNVQCFATKGGMVKTDDQIHGVVLKGVSDNFDSLFFKENLLEGRLFRFDDSVASNEIIISKTLADKLMFDLGDKVRTYFWQDNNYRARAFEIVGIYSTDLAEFDEAFIVGDIRTVQKLNNWNANQVGGYEILIDNFENLSAYASLIYDMLDYDLTLSTVKEENPVLFSWLDLLNTNIILILSVMSVVCMVSIVSALLIMIFEKTSMIGLLKTLGATNSSIRKIFIYKSISIIGKGLVIGNMVALALCLLQSKYNIVTLDSESYSMSSVPVDINVWVFVLVSIGTMAVCLLALLIPTGFIAKVSPAKTIRVE
jgi:lipoprotein-releasing system permease protein